MSKPWYAKGLRFECTMCGRCCSGPTGVVVFTREEAEAMAAFLGLSTEDFLERYSFTLGDQLALGEVDAPGGDGFDCALLERDPESGRAHCKVYSCRPNQCRTFPWWPENLKSPRTWKRVARECEGIGRGPLVPLEVIRRERDATR